MKILARGTTKHRKALEMADAVPVWVHTQGNGFKGTLLPEHCYVDKSEGGPKSEYLAALLETFRFARLQTYEDNYCLRVHSNEWYEWSKGVR